MAEEHVAAGTFKTHCLRLMDEVSQSHRPIVITKHGKPIAKGVPFEVTPAPLYGQLKGSATISDDLLAPLAESWDAEQ